MAPVLPKARNTKCLPPPKAQRPKNVNSGFQRNSCQGQELKIPIMQTKQSVVVAISESDVCFVTHPFPIFGLWGSASDWHYQMYQRCVHEWQHDLVWYPGLFKNYGYSKLQFAGPAEITDCDLFFGPAMKAPKFPLWKCLWTLWKASICVHKCRVLINSRLMLIKLNLGMVVWWKRSHILHSTWLDGLLPQLGK